jgi:hypothetical protein
MDTIVAPDTDISCCINSSMQHRTIKLQQKHLEFHHQEILKQRRLKPIKATNKKIATMRSIMVPPDSTSHPSFIKWTSTNPLYDDDIKLIVSPTSGRHHRDVNRTMDVDADGGEDKDENDYYELVFQSVITLNKMIERLS